ncbi:MAG: FAD-dependent oxidoreductase, partial [Gemmatimonadaceae bacterium]
ASKLAPNGSGDRKVQSYNYRMALCQGDKRVPIARPARYDSARYELLLRLIEKTPDYRLNQRFKIDPLINGKTDWNNQGAFSTDYIGHSWAYPEADYATRERIKREHEDYQKGLLHFVSNDPRIPAALQKEMQSWGYCRDEFLDTGGWPHQLYVREARRMVGEYVMTEHNARGSVTVTDGVGMAAYTMDSHNIERVVMNGMVKNEGDVQVGGFPPYPIAYRSIVPKRAQATNLLVPVALSASHIAYGSIRMEPVFMVLAQAAAIAASRAIDGRSPVQQVDVPALQRELAANPRADGSAPELLVDDANAEQVAVTGPWVRATTPGRFGPGVLQAPASGAGSVRFTPRIAHTGRYRVYMYWPRPRGLATNAPVRLHHAAGMDSLAIDLTAVGENAQGVAAWTLLGERTFSAGRDGWVEVGAERANGIVLADAVLFVPVADSDR